MAPNRSENNGASVIPHLSHSRIQKYLTCPEQYRLHYIEGVRPKYEAAARAFGVTVHQALAEMFRYGKDPVVAFQMQWKKCADFQLRYSQRDSWARLNDIGIRLLEKFLHEETQKIQGIFAVETPFEIGLSNINSPFVGVLDLLAIMDDKMTLVEFKTAASDWEEYEVSISDQLTAYYLAEPKIQQAAVCVLVKKKEPEIVWHFTERRPEQQVEYLQKAELIAGHIANHVFYKRIGFWCRQCDFLPMCAGDKAEAEEKLIRTQ